MNRILKRITISVAVVGLTALMLAIGSYVAGARINITKSIPIGLYWTSAAAVDRGAYVLWCPPKDGVFDDAKVRGYIGSGFCHGGYGYMMKRVLAAKDDVVSVADDGVRVNGALLPHSKPIHADKFGRPLPCFWASTYTLSNAELLLMSDVSNTSFDGRYFGPINRSQVQTVIRPVITW